MVLARSFKKRVIVVGAGYAGVCAITSMAKRLKKEFERRDVEMLLIEPNNFQQTLSEFDLIAATSRSRNADFCKLFYSQLFGRVPWGALKKVTQRATCIDPVAKTVTVEDGSTYEYWKLILATGAEPYLPPIEGLKEFAIPIWSMLNIYTLHDKIGEKFELARYEPDPRIRKELLTFTVIGGGDTGVEIIGTFGKQLPKLCKLYGIDPSEMTLRLIEGREEILSHLDPWLREKALDYMQRKLGIEVITGRPVERMEYHKIYLDGKPIDSAVTVWAGGVKASSTASCWGLPVGTQNRIVGTEELKVAGHDDIYVIGDLAQIPWKERDGYCHMVAQFAVPEGLHAAKNIAHELRGEDVEPFVPTQKGEFISIGNYCVGWMFNLKLIGLPAMFMKRLTYIEYWFVARGPWFALRRTMQMIRLLGE